MWELILAYLQTMVVQKHDSQTGIVWLCRLINWVFKLYLLWEKINKGFWNVCVIWEEIGWTDEKNLHYKIARSKMTVETGLTKG